MPITSAGGGFSTRFQLLVYANHPSCGGLANGLFFESFVHPSFRLAMESFAKPTSCFGDWHKKVSHELRVSATCLCQSRQQRVFSRRVFCFSIFGATSFRLVLVKHQAFQSTPMTKRARPPRFSSFASIRIPPPPSPLLCRGVDFWCHRHCKTSPVDLHGFQGQVWPGNVSKWQTKLQNAKLVALFLALF